MDVRSYVLVLLSNSGNTIRMNLRSVRRDDNFFSRERESASQLLALKMMSASLSVQRSNSRNGN